MMQASICRHAAGLAVLWNGAGGRGQCNPFRAAQGGGRPAPPGTMAATQAVMWRVHLDLRDHSLTSNFEWKVVCDDGVIRYRVKSRFQLICKA